MMSGKPPDDLGSGRSLKLEPPFYVPGALPQCVRDGLLPENVDGLGLHFPVELFLDDEFCAALNEALRASSGGQLP